MKKRLLSFVLAVVLMTGIFPVVSASVIESGKCGANVTWTFDSNGTLTINGNGGIWDDDSLVGGGPWRQYKNDIQNVIINNGVTYIGASVFEACNISNVAIPSSVTGIGSSAFKNCKKLESITIPKGVTRIEDYTFFGCTNLTEIIISESVTHIGSYALSGCAFKYVDIPSSVKNFGRSVFRECKKLESIVIPYGVTLINDSQFLGCESLKSVKISNTVTGIEDYAFSNCKSLEFLMLPESVTRIEVGVFNSCENLSRILISNNKISIKSWVFDGCKNLNDVYFGGSKEEWEKLLQANSNPISLWGGAVIHYNIQSVEQIPPVVCLNNNKIYFDQPPVIDNGRTLVPVRAIFEAMGMSVSWDDATSTVTASGNGKTLSLVIGNTQAVVNGAVHTLDVPAQIINGRTLVPTRFVAEALGATVSWDADARIVNITYTPFNFAKEINTQSFKMLIRSDRSFDKWYEWCVESIDNGDACWAAASVLEFWKDPKEYVLKEAGEAIDANKAYQEYYTAVLTDALLNGNSGNMLREEIEKEQIQAVAQGYIDLIAGKLENIVEEGISENKAELKQLEAELWDIVRNPNFTGNRESLSKIEEDFERVLGKIDSTKLKAADMNEAKKILDGFGVAMDIVSVGYEGYKEVESIKALQNIKMRYIGGLQAIRDKTSDINLKAAATNLIGIMNNSFNETVGSVLKTSASAFLQSDAAEEIAVNFLKKGATKALTLIFKVGAEQAADMVSNSFSVVAAGVAAGKITTAVCDVVAGTSKSVNASMDLKMTMTIENAISSIIANEYQAMGSDLSNCTKEFAGICEVQKAVMCHASCLTNIIYNAQDNSDFDKVIRAAMDKEVYNDTHDRVTASELDNIRMIRFICIDD